jgi:hypothetical protein
VPILFRVRVHKDDTAAAIYFNPNDRGVPMLFNPFFDRGELVTAAYWGSHWPLARGNTTGATIDDRITITPSHNSMMTWGMSNRPAPVSSAEIMTLDALGRSKMMNVQRWAWLIGMTPASDADLLAWAASFGTPASLETKGARLDVNSWVMERRAYRLIAEQKALEIAIRPTAPVINPVFEIDGAGRRIASVQLDGSAVNGTDYTWDGSTLWLKARLDKPATLSLRFGD